MDVAKGHATKMGGTMSNTITARALADRFAELSAMDSDQRWSQWSDLYRAMRDRPAEITLKDLVAASKATTYPMGQSTVQDCILAADFCDNPHADSILSQKYEGKRPTRVHTLVRAAIVAIGKGATATVRGMAVDMSAELTKISGGKRAADAKADKSRKVVAATLAELTKAGTPVAGKRKPRPAAEKSDTVAAPVAAETVQDQPKTGAEYLAAMSGVLGKFGDMAANGRLVAADREAWTAFRERVAAIDALVNSNRAGRRVS